jgi:HEAT repeat protein
MKKVRRFDWGGFEEELLGVTTRALSRLELGEGERVYAVAPYGVYRELDGLISLPLLALNTASAGAPADAQGFWGERWNPPDWSRPEIDLGDEAAALEEALVAEATRGSQRVWEDTWARYHEVVLGVTRGLGEWAAGNLPLTDDAVVFWFDAEGGPELAAETIPRELFSRLFAPQVQQELDMTALSKRPRREQAAYLVTRLGRYDGIDTERAQERLRWLGTAAIPALLGVLDDPEVGWTAAKLLGHLDAPSKKVIAALRAGVELSLWHPMALGMLGDHAWLAGQEAEVAVLGLTARLKAITGLHPAPRLDYAHLEAWLDGAEPEAVARAERELEPGRGYMKIKAKDVDEALRGLASPHAVVRWHAASVLGDRALGKRAAARVPPALAVALEDPHPFVRRLSVLSLGWWRAAAAPHRDAMARLAEDPDETVRGVVGYALEQLPPAR